MTVTKTKESTLGNSSAIERTIFVCPLMPYIIWDLNNPTSFVSFQFAITVRSISCPVIILLNGEENKRAEKELKHSAFQPGCFRSFTGRRILATGNHCLCVSSPGTCSSGFYLYHRYIDYVIISVMFAAICISISFLVLIAWERYVAVTKWADQSIVTKGCLKKYAKIAWLLALLWCISVSIVSTYRPLHKVMVTMDILTSLMLALGLVLIVYYYIMVYRGVRKWNRSQMRQVQALVNAKVETKAAYTAFLVTVSVVVSIFPTLLVYAFGDVWPSLRRFRFSGGLGERFC